MTRNTLLSKKTIQIWTIFNIKRSFLGLFAWVSILMICISFVLPRRQIMPNISVWDSTSQTLGQLTSPVLHPSEPTHDPLYCSLCSFHPAPYSTPFTSRQELFHQWLFTLHFLKCKVDHWPKLEVLNTNAIASRQITQLDETSSGKDTRSEQLWWLRGWIPSLSIQICIFQNTEYTHTTGTTTMVLGLNYPDTKC